jgi:hypothetical protein
MKNILAAGVIFKNKKKLFCYIFIQLFKSFHKFHDINDQKNITSLSEFLEDSFKAHEE